MRDFKLHIRWCLCSKPQHFLLILQLLFLLQQHFKYFVEKSHLPGGRVHCSCEIWHQHCSSMYLWYVQIMTENFWLACSSCKFSFLFVLHFFFSWHQFIHHHVNIWTEHWQTRAAQLPMWGAPCILQVRIHCLYFVESFAFETTINTICCHVH